MRQCLLGFMSSRDGLIARWIRKARREVLKWTLFLSLFNLLCWTRRCSPLNLRRWPLHPSDNSLGRVVVFVRLNWLLLISLADLCPEPMGCVSVLLSLLTVREKTKTNRCGQVCICDTSVWVWLRQHLSSDLPVGAVDAPCLVAGLVAVWLRATAVPGFCVAWVARQRLFLVPGRAIATNSGTPWGSFVTLYPRYMTSQNYVRNF